MCKVLGICGLTLLNTIVQIALKSLLSQYHIMHPLGLAGWLVGWGFCVVLLANVILR